eukprot:TRINITY_DN11588_c0_g1_i1.p1 TRINITY_DN11588_c0_g1~~TRINITY_DN11588_c0_g1_i1.p1  ORF type:complete len:542 (-),score=69.04 TRINITY_DN11588_c0_g1_i1:7-1608(-)
MEQEETIAESYRYKNEVDKNTRELHNTIRQFISPIHFSVSIADTDQPWFHKDTTRSEIHCVLEQATIGKFLIRPSSQTGCYALSYKDRDKVRHQLIYSIFPGYSLKNDPNKSEVYESLSDLIESCSYLNDYLPAPSYDFDGISEDHTKTGAQITANIVNKLQTGNELFTSLTWSLNIIEGPENYTSPDKCERRTYIKFCNKEHMAPCIYKITEGGPHVIFPLLKNNSTLKSLQISGHDGFMYMNFTPNIGDVEIEILCEYLKSNKSLTNLILSNNNISDVGAEHIADLLYTNRTISHIDLECNLIHTEGLKAIASSLQYNPTVYSINISKQLNENFSGYTLRVDSYDSMVIRLIEETFKRRNELINDEVPFHGFLLKEIAEEKVMEYCRGKPGYYLFYLDKHYPNILYMCYSIIKNDDISYQHKPIYRNPYGYCFVTTYQFGEETLSLDIPSLWDYSSWYIAGQVWQGEILFEDIPPEAQEEVEIINHYYFPLWRLMDLPPTVNNRSNIAAFPTLSYLIQRNKKIFCHRVDKV